MPVPIELPPGFTPPRTQVGPLELTYDAAQNLLQVLGNETVVRVRLLSEPQVLRVVLEDFT